MFGLKQATVRFCEPSMGVRRPCVLDGCRAEIDQEDGGDAATDLGLDLGLGVGLADSVTGLAVNVRVRRLLVQQAAGFAKNGMTVSVSYDASPDSPLGLTAGRAVGPGTMGSMNDPLVAGTGGSHLEAEVRHGLPIGCCLMGRRESASRTSEYGRDYPVGYRMQVLEEGQLLLQLSIEAERRVSLVFGLLGDAGGGAEQRVVGRASVEW